MGQATNHLAIWAWSLVCSRASSLPLPCGKKGSEVHQGDTRLHPIKPEMDVLSSVNVQAWIPFPLSLLHVLVENHRVTFGMRHLLTEQQELFEKKNTHVQCTDGCDYVSCSHQTEMILLFFKYAIIFTANCEMLKLFMMVDKMSALLKLWVGASGFIDLPNKSCMGDPRWLVKIVNLH